MALVGPVAEAGEEAGQATDSSSVLSRVPRTSAPRSTPRSDELRSSAALPVPLTQPLAGASVSRAGGEAVPRRPEGACPALAWRCSHTSKAESSAVPRVRFYFCVTRDWAGEYGDVPHGLGAPELEVACATLSSDGGCGAISLPHSPQGTCLLSAPLAGIEQPTAPFHYLVRRAAPR